MNFTLNCVAQQYVPAENEEIYGMWENVDYEAKDAWYEIGYEAIVKMRFIQAGHGDAICERG